MKADWTELLQKDLGRLSRVAGVSIPDSTPALQEGERRRITVLFLDMEGFTSLSEQLDHETVHSLVNGIMSSLARIVEAHGGYVDKFEGDRIMALFGAKSATEENSIRAVSCGFRMQEALDEIADLLSAHGLQIGSRIGIETGTATVAPDPKGHLTATGRCVNVASRLEEAAEPDTILTTGAVKKQCGKSFEWSDLGTRRLKGISDPVHVFSPLALGKTVTERWERSALLERSPLVGRDHELALLRDYVRLEDDEVDVTWRGGAVHLLVVVHGRAGMGKSRLVHDFVQLLPNEKDSRNTVLTGHSASFAQPPFRLWIDLFRRYFDIGPGTEDPAAGFCRGMKELLGVAGSDQGRAALGSARPFLAEMLSIPDEPKPPKSIPEEARHKGFLVAIREFVRTLLSGRRRIVLVLEDLHWIDPSSAEALRFLLENCDSERPMIVLCTARPHGEDAGCPLLRMRSDYFRALEIELEPLEAGDCEELIAHMMGRGALSNARLRNFLLSRSQGNPFYLEELIIQLVESGLAASSDDGWQLAGDPEAVVLPSSVAGLIQARVDGLPKSMRQGLQRASVLGMSFSEALFSAMSAGLSLEGDQTGVLKELCTRGFLETIGAGDDPGSAYRFYHNLVRKAAYETLLLGNRAVLHKRAASALEELTSHDEGERSAEISRHWELAGVREKAVRWGIRALDHARNSYQLKSVLEWADRIEDWLGGQPQSREDLDDLLMICGKRIKALHFAGRRDEEERAIGRMLELSRSREGFLKWEAVALRSLAKLYSITGRTEKSFELFDRALQIATKLGHPDLEGDVLSQMGIFYISQGRNDRALEMLSAALEKAEEHDNELVEALVLGNLGILYRIMGRLEEAAECHERALGIFDRASDRRNVGVCLCSLSLLHFVQGKRVEAIEEMRKALEVAKEVGDRWFEGSTIANLAIFHRRTGDLQKALDCYRAAVRITGEVGDRAR
ncbi:tetratricopeptide repeat protein, partial [Candidatus Fermentibacteria bacterium]|nr:tetratricopeptide repeat protein [Candidatus Fermentibacteria bacterium]